MQFGKSNVIEWLSDSNSQVQDSPPEIQEIINQYPAISLSYISVFDINCRFLSFKYRNPISIFEKFKFSARGSKNLFITTPNPSNLYIYHASVAWNFARTLMTVKDTSTSISTFKLKKN